MDNKNIDNRKKRDHDIKASFAMDGITFNPKDEAMFRMFDEKGWTTEQCIAYIQTELQKNNDA